MKNLAITATVTGLILVALFLLYYYQQRERGPSKDERVTEEPVTAHDIEPQSPLRPIVDEVDHTPQTLPDPDPVPEPPADMEAADQVLRERHASADPALREVFDYDYLVSKVVTATDLIYREKNPMSQLPFLIMKDELIVERIGNKVYLSEQNYTRYEKWVNVFSRLDVGAMAGTYRFLKPLFAQAFEELGIPERDWKTTAPAVVDYLLALEVPAERPALIQVGKTFLFADNDLESLTPTHKAFIRMGPENCRRIKAKLRAVKAAM